MCKVMAYLLYVCGNLFLRGFHNSARTFTRIASYRKSVLHNNRHICTNKKRAHAEILA